MTSIATLTVEPGPGPNQRDAHARSAEVERLGDAIAELSARIQAATYELLVLVRTFDEREGWNEGFRSCAHWLNWRTGLDLGAAREKVRVARALGNLPGLGGAMQRGEISYSKVRALTRVATPENEADLLDFARCATAAHVERLVRAWRRVDRVAEATDDERRHESRHLETWVDDDGMVVIRGRLPPEVGAVVQRALDAAADRLHGEADTDVETTAAQRRADALGLVAESALAADLDPGTAGDRYQVVVHVAHVDGEMLPRDAGPGQAVLEGAGGDGLDVSAETSRRLACDASTVVMRHGPSGRVLDVGRKTRTISAALRRALTARDRRCRFPGCQARHCDAHHVRHWADGGATRLDNLVLLCRRHHRAVHEEGFSVALHGDHDDDSGEVRFVQPDGCPLPEAPSSPRWIGAPLAPVRSRHEAIGIWIDPHTATPNWHGERLDETWAIDVMWRPRSEPAPEQDVSAETSPTPN